MKRWRVAGAVGPFLVSFLAAIAQPVAAAETDCIGKSADGKAVCSSPEVRQYTSLQLCDEWDGVDTGFHRFNKTCSAWGGCNGVPSKLTPHNMVAKAIEFMALAHHVDGGPGCQVSGSSPGWLSSGQTLSSGKCWSGGPTYSGGVEVSNLMRVNTTGVGKGHGQTACTAAFAENVMGRRSRTADCPAGYKKRSLGGTNYECYRFEEQECPCCGGGCKVGNPVSPATGKKTQVEVDYEGTGTHALRLVRSYSSYGWYSVAGKRDDKSSTMDGYWRINYDRRVYAIASSAYASAVAVRGDGNVKYFSASGKEIVNKGTSRDFLETLADGSGNILGWRYLTAGNDVEEYDAEGKLLSITSPEGLVQTFEYSDASTPPSIAEIPGLLIKATDAFGRSLAFTYDARDRVVSATDPEGVRYEYVYSTSSTGNLLQAKVVNTAGEITQRTYHYENATFLRALTGITDEKSNRIGTYQYDTSGRATLTQGADGTNAYTLVYGTGATTVTDPLNTTRTFTYQSTGGVLRNTSMVQSGDTTSILYDTRGFVSTRTGFNGVVTAFEHDDDGRETSRTEAFGTADARTTTTEWHATLRLPSRVLEFGRETTYSYTSGGKRLSETVKDLATDESRTTSYTYNALGLVATIDGPRTDVADVTTYEYDASGNLNRVTNALGHVTQITNHDANGRPLRVLDPNGVETVMTYDERGRLSRRVIAGATTTFDYDDAGLLAKVTMPDGSFLSYTYDAAHRLTDVGDNLGNRIHYTLDANGNRIQEEVYDPADVLKRRQSQVFDALGQLDQIKNAAGDVITDYSYDGQGNRTSQMDAGSFETIFTPDALNRTRQVTDAAGGVTAYGYNALDQLVSVTDPKGLITSYTLNALGDLKQQVSPDTGTTSYTYDSAGNRKTQTDARGVTASFSYDALNRVTAADYSGTAEDVTYTYDSTAQPYGKGRLTGTVDENGSAVLEYDARGTLSKEARVIEGRSYVTSYTYDVADRLLQITYPTDRVVDYARDELGRTSAVWTDWENGVIAPAVDMKYLPFGPRGAFLYANGWGYQDRGYDQNYRMTYVWGQGVQRAFDYDLRGNVKHVDDSVNPARTADYDYDELGRLTWMSTLQLTYQYDANGNRTFEQQVHGASAINNYSYITGSNQLAAVSGTTNAAFTYDPAGNVTQKAGLNLTYGQSGRLHEARRDGALVATYRYRADGQRGRKTVYNAAGLSATILFHYDYQGRLLAETTTAGQLIREYIWMDELPMAMIARPNPPGGVDQSPINAILVQAGAIPPQNGVLPQFEFFYLHADHLGTPLAGLHHAGQALWWDAAFKPFGEIYYPATNKVDQPLRFPGQYFDAETWLYQNVNRDYDPSLGRYLQPDPTGLDDGPSVYAYVGSNPIVYTDPEGLVRIRNEEWQDQDHTPCAYYEQVAQKHGCKYHAWAAGACRGNDSGVNFMVNTCSLTNTKKLNCIRRCLIRKDQEARNNPSDSTGPGGSGDACGPGGCTKRKAVNRYHRECFRECGSSAACYGGNYSQDFPSDD